jgi:hypothetical protein
MLAIETKPAPKLGVAGFFMVDLFIMPFGNILNARALLAL